MIGWLSKVPVIGVFGDGTKEEWSDSWMWI